MTLEESLTAYIEKREGMNYSDAQDLAYEILDLIEKYTGGNLR